MTRLSKDLSGVVLWAKTIATDLAAFRTYGPFPLSFSLSLSACLSIQKDDLLQTPLRQ